MSDPLGPVVDVLEQTPPFDQLDGPARARLARKLEIEYHRRGSEVRAVGAAGDRLFLVRSGALSETDGETLLVSRYGEGEIAGVEELLTGDPCRTALRATEDTLLYALSKARFEELLRDSPSLARGLTASVGHRLREASLALAKAEPSLGSVSVPVGTLMRRSLISIAAVASVREAAALMRREGVSALVITGRPLLGILTDRDLRNRVLAAGLDGSTRVSEVMTSPVVTVQQDLPLFEALLLMMDREVHHLVVVDRLVPVGVITTTDLIRAQSENPVFVVGDVQKQTTLQGLIRANQAREQVLCRLVASGARALDVHRVLSRIADAVMRRLIRLGEAELGQRELGEMPGHCWVVFGSLARSELSVGSDQDNGLVLASGVAADHPAPRFLAEWVARGLDRCGYPMCRGEIMASTRRWRQPVETWQDYFRKWIRTPQKEAVMRASIFFDLRAIDGDEGLVTELEREIMAEVDRQPVFVAHMARDAIARQPPLGLFRQFVVEKSGEHVDALDLKHRGVIPVVDLARVHALEAGFLGRETVSRLRAAADAGNLSAAGCSDLVSAFEYIASLRLRHQASALSEGRPPDSFVRPDDISKSERGHLREAFRVIKDIQESLYVSRQLGAFSG